MKILIVASVNNGQFAPFILEQAAALEQEGCEVEWFGLQGKGVKGYLRNLSPLKKRIGTSCPNVIHAHYGLSGLLANLQRKVPVVVTYHGSDINEPEVLRYSEMAMQLAAWNVFVSRQTLEIAQPKTHYSLLPCGVDLSDVQLTTQSEARKHLGLSDQKRIVLFAGAFENGVKNASLAKEVVAQLHDGQAELLELKGYSREEVNLYMCAANVLLMTSFTEGSPQVIKEAMACGCPIVSVDVGDVKMRTEGVEGCFVATTRNPNELAGLVQKAFAFEGKTQGRDKLIADGLDNRNVARQLLAIYDKVCLK